MKPTINAPVEAAAAALATAATSPMTATGEETLTLVWDLARIAHHLGELTAAARDRWAAWGTVTPHLRQAEVLVADATRCLSHAAGTYAFNATRPDPAIVPLAATDTARPAA
ncbi:MAG: hypothetical protein JO063_06400 [Pseudonocardiales bacterium]|nr:hypothetical protein [Pseudonocardiales bacterium]MBV9029524.1 hypothetical protein [Pseudonocardiales bacterium]MBW0009735.1 hypothetical protein [Pseudonocardiales bacterium]